MALTVLLRAVVLMFSARAVGSHFAHLRGALRVSLILAVVGITFFFIGIAVERASGNPLYNPVLSLVEFGLFFIIMSRCFKLSFKRTWAPFGAFLGISALEIVLAILLIRPFLIEAFIVPSDGMSPTIQPNDQFVANKIISPKRWDLVVYRNKLDGQVYCKRLVGLPGERLRFSSGTVFINDREETPPVLLAGRLHARSVEHPTGDWKYRDDETIALASNEFFVIGDNVERSLDSRYSGPSDRASLIGVVDWIYCPVSRMRLVR